MIPRKSSRGNESSPRARRKGGTRGLDGFRPLAVRTRARRRGRVARRSRCCRGARYVPMTAKVRDTVAVRLIGRVVAGEVVERMSLIRPLLARTIGTRDDRHITARCRACRGCEYRPYGETSGGARSPRRRVDIEEIESHMIGGIHESRASTDRFRLRQIALRRDGGNGGWGWSRGRCRCRCRGYGRDRHAAAAAAVTAAACGECHRGNAAKRKETLIHDKCETLLTRLTLECMHETSLKAAVCPYRQDGLLRLRHSAKMYGAVFTTAHRGR
jgi:hypothetical protein